MAGARIFITEDEGVIAMDLRRQLEAIGFEVVGTAASAEQAIAGVAATRPDLVLMDIVIKGPVDGITVAERLRDAYGVPVVFLTAYSDERTLSRAREVGAYGYLIKPLRGEDLRAAIEVALFKRRMERALHESEARFRSAFDHAPIGMALLDAEARIVQANHALGAMLGRRADALAGLRLADFQHAEDAGSEAEPMARLAIGEIADFQLEQRLLDASGATVWVLLSVSAVRGEDGAPLHCIAQLQDVSERKRAEEELLRLAHFDPLTGLLNRAQMNDRLAGALALARRRNETLALLFIDLDGFKLVNDSLGHQAGDDLLREVAQRILGALRDSDVAARWGGDEFVVLAHDLQGTEAAARVAQKVIDAVAQPYAVRGLPVAMSASVGIALFPEHAENPVALMVRADNAMYRAKELGKNQYRFASPEASAEALRQLRLESSLRRALAQDELKLHYQPIYRAGRVAAVEALLRWESPEAGLVSPAEFMPLAEKSGLIVPIGAWVLRGACRQMKAWLAAGLAGVRIAVNLSARQFRDPELAATVAAALAESGLAAEALELEITESSVMSNPPAAAATLRELRRMGVHVTVDDFGTGHSSLAYLRRFPIGSLKIDRSFLQNVPGDADAEAIVVAILGLARSLKLEVVAEGVETAAQAAFLRSHGCDTLQGFLLCRPGLPEEIAGLLAPRLPALAA